MEIWMGVKYAPARAGTAPYGTIASILILRIIGYPIMLGHQVPNTTPYIRKKFRKNPDPETPLTGPLFILLREHIKTAYILDCSGILHVVNREDGIIYAESGNHQRRMDGLIAQHTATRKSRRNEGNCGHTRGPSTALCAPPPCQGEVSPISRFIVISASALMYHPQLPFSPTRMSAPGVLSGSAYAGQEPGK